MKTLLLAVLTLSGSSLCAQPAFTAKLDEKGWKPQEVTAGIGRSGKLTVFTIVGQRDLEQLVLSADFEALRGKKSAAFILTEELMLPSRGASISYAPKGPGKQQWVSAGGKLVLTEFNEKSGTAAGTFEATLAQLVDDSGRFILKTPRPFIKVTGRFSKVSFAVAP